MNSDEIEYLRSLQTVVVTDERWIDTLACILALPMHVEESQNGSDLVQVSCQRADASLVSFTVTGHALPFTWMSAGVLRTDDGLHFRYRGREAADPLLAPEIRPFALRKLCAANLSTVGAWSSPRRRDGSDGTVAEHWCDDVRQMLRELAEIYGEPYGETFTKRIFMCPGVAEGECHYAMNSSCTSESPEDCVFLFEAQPGWNQHGGPELFTFDNHHPRGGNVLLKDGTLKFVRTQELLRQLPWK